MLHDQNPTTGRPPFARLSREEQVLALFLTDQATTVAEIADQLDLSIEAVAEILDSDKSKALIATVRRLANLRAEVIAAEVRTEAIYITRRVANATTNHETARRAASALLRLQPLPTVRRAAPSASSPATGGGGQLEAQPQAGGGVSVPRVSLPAHPAPTPAFTPELHRAAKEALAAIARRLAPGASLTPNPPTDPNSTDQTFPLTAPPTPPSRDSPQPHLNGKAA